MCLTYILAKHLKGFIFKTAILITALTMFAFRLEAQTESALYVVVDYMKVQPETNAAYLNFEQEIWKPMHEERVKRGIIVGWYLYAVEFSGTGDEYNYVVINLYDSAERLESPWDADIPRQIHPSKSIQDILQETQKTRQTVKSELYYSVATAPRIPLETPAPFMQVNYMQVEPGKQADYEQLETDIWLPIHNQSILSGQTRGWGLWRSLFPRGAGRDYQYLTLNTFSDFSTIFNLDFSESFGNIHPGEEFSDIMMKTRETRAIARTELWDLIDYTIR